MNKIDILDRRKTLNNKIAKYTIPQAQQAHNTISTRKKLANRVAK